MKRIRSIRIGQILVTAALLAFSAALSEGKSQKKSTDMPSGNENAVLATAMQNMTSGVWSVNGTVTFKKTIKLRGLLSGADYDLSMEPGVIPNAPMRGIVIKD